MAFLPCCLRRQGQQTTSFLENVWFFGLGTPGLQKTTWPQKPLRDPFYRWQPIFGSEIVGFAVVVRLVVTRRAVTAVVARRGEGLTPILWASSCGSCQATLHPGSLDTRIALLACSNFGH
jgi:hypothetical protein